MTRIGLLRLAPRPADMKLRPFWIVSTYSRMARVIASLPR